MENLVKCKTCEDVQNLYKDAYDTYYCLKCINKKHKDAQKGDEKYTAQKKYFKTDKGKEALREAKRKYYLKQKAKLPTPK
jgi:hypothetical protein